MILELDPQSKLLPEPPARKQQPERINQEEMNQNSSRVVLSHNLSPQRKLMKLLMRLLYTQNSTTANTYEKKKEKSVGRWECR